MHTFDALGLSEPVVRALTEAGITTPTPIQQQAIPILMQGATDLLGLAQTGTGKTAAFGLPLLERIEAGKAHTQAVILSPTRELAQQIATALASFARYMPHITIDVVYGGTPITAQIRLVKQRAPKILVATPGRLIDLIDRKVINLNTVSTVILDEADEMLNMGFKEDIDNILSHTRSDKNTWLFSATMPREIKDIVHRYMHQPAEVNIASQNKVNLNIEHRYAMVKRRDKRAALERIIDAEGDMYALIFCRTKNDTQELAQAMAADGYPVEAIHGDLSQGQRNSVMAKFKAGRAKLLAATDVAARGIDVDNLTHVIHYELPDDLSFYTHRSGRTARAGKKGIAIALITPDDQRKISYLEKQLNIQFKKTLIPSAEEVANRYLQNRLDDLLQIEPTPEAKIWAQALAHQAEEHGWEAFFERWITSNMDGLKSSGADLNAAAFDRDKRDKPSKGKFDRQERLRPGERFERRSDRPSTDIEENMASFHLNLGRADGLKKGDVLKLVCDATGVRSKHIGRIQLGDQRTTVDIEKPKSKGFVEAFDGLRLNGRKLKAEKGS